MNNNVSVVEQCNDDWAASLRQRSFKKRSKAELLMEKYVEILVNRWPESKAKIQKKMDTKRRVPLEPMSQPMWTTNQSATFDGNLQQWQDFWDIFNAYVHTQQHLPPV